MTDERRKPFYQKIDGFCVGGLIWPNAFRSATKYQPRKGDFFIVTFPKCGTTWTQQIVSLIYDKGQSVSSITDFMYRSPFLEFVGAEAADIMKRPGAMKLHLPYHLTPMSPDAKYLYVVRNPKDTVISFYHHTRTMFYRFENGSFEDFFEIFINGENDFGDYFEHVLGWYEHRNDPNVMFLTYEELKRDTPNTIKKIAKFMGDEYLTMLEEEEDVFNNVLKYCSFEHMKFLNDTMKDFASPDTANDERIQKLPGLRYVFEQLSKSERAEVENPSQFIRKGIVGDWRNNFTDDQNRRLNERIEKELKDTEILKYWKSIDCL